MVNKVIQKKLHIENGSLCYYVYGDITSDVTIFFFNGLYHGRDLWTKQQRSSYLKSNTKMVFIDYRGAGDSIFYGDTYPYESIIHDLQSVINTERSSHNFIIGYSLGGVLAIDLCQKLRDQIAGIILLNSGSDLNIKARSILNEVLNLLDRNISLKDILRLILPWNYSDQYLAEVDDFKNIILESYTQYNRNTEALKHFLNAIKNRPHHFKTSAIFHIPTMIIGGDEDQIFPKKHQLELHNQQPQSTLHILPNCGHVSILEKSDSVVFLIESFLKRSITCSKNTIESLN